MGPKGPRNAKENKRSQSKHTFDFLILTEQEDIFSYGMTWMAKKGLYVTNKRILFCLSPCVLFLDLLLELLMEDSKARFFSLLTISSG